MNKKYFFLLTLLFAFLGGVKSYSINTNSGIVAKQIYQIRAKDQARGVLYAGNTTNDGAHPNNALSAAGSTYTRMGITPLVPSLSTQLTHISNLLL